MISKTSKFVFVLLLVSVVLVSGCSSSPPSTDDSKTSNSNVPTDNSVTSPPADAPKTAPQSDTNSNPPNEGDKGSTPTETATKPGSDTSTPSTKEFSIIAKQFEFQPSTITVKKGDHVKLTVKSIDVTHGFSLPDFNVNTNLEPNKETVVEFTPDKTGSFTFFCSVFCGSGHSSMRGTLVATE